MRVEGVGFTKGTHPPFSASHSTSPPPWKFSLLLKLTEVSLLLCDVPFSSFVSVGSALVEKQREPALVNYGATYHSRLDKCVF